MTEFVDKSIGATLRERRVELGIPLEEVVTRTRIRQSYLEALEADQFDAFPGDTYLKGYLKGYAECLGLDPQVLLRALAGVHAMAPSPIPVEPVPRPNRPLALRGVSLLVGAVVLLLLAWVLFGRPTTQPGPETPAGNQVQQPQLPVTGQDLASPREPLTLEQDSAVTPAVQPATEPAALNSDSDATLTASAASPGSETSTSPQATAITDPVVSQGGTGVLRLQASGPGRLELTIDGRPAQRYTLQANTILSWKVTRAVSIYLENPASVRMWLGEKEIDLAGRNQIVLQSAKEPSR